MRLSEEDLSLLFGPGYHLSQKRALSRAEGFLAEERLTLVTARGQLTEVAVLGPARPVTKIRLGEDEARRLGVDEKSRRQCCAPDSPNLCLITSHGMAMLRWFEGREEYPTGAGKDIP